MSEFQHNDIGVFLTRGSLKSTSNQEEVAAFGERAQILPLGLSKVVRRSRTDAMSPVRICGYERNIVPHSIDAYIRADVPRESGKVDRRRQFRCDLPTQFSIRTVRNRAGYARLICRLLMNGDGEVEARRQLPDGVDVEVMDPREVLAYV